ncbi:hypothetical protein HD806DRAFT_535991 [Xylariaceae sp. AK1471]|nr:hypothetical protein HD806DRAFT_535991 [Xylariaceae sp. AK1471]
MAEKIKVTLKAVTETLLTLLVAKSRMWGCRARFLVIPCGLDSRYQWVDWGFNMRWIEVDLLDVIALRRRVLPISLPRKNYQLVDTEITEGTWQEASRQTDLSS